MSTKLAQHVRGRRTGAAIVPEEIELGFGHKSILVAVPEHIHGVRLERAAGEKSVITILLFADLSTQSNCLCGFKRETHLCFVVGAWVTHGKALHVDLRSIVQDFFCHSGHVHTGITLARDVEWILNGTIHGPTTSQRA